MQKKLLLLGGSRYLLPVIKKAHDLGAYVITCDYLPDNFAHKFSDEYHNVSIIDKDAVLSLAQELKIDGIMSFACDPGVVTAAYVAEKMNLPGIPYKSACILQNKNLFRTFLAENGFNCPFHKSYKTYEEALNESNDLPYPVIVKPTDSAGSKGVSRVDSATELNNALDFAFDNSISGEVIVEKFLEKVGSSSDTDCFSINNNLVYASFDCQLFDLNAPNPYTPAGYLWPSNMSAESQEYLYGEIQRLIRLLNLGTSIYNVETRQCTDGKSYIMELSPRGGGNRLSEVLEMATNQSLIENNIRFALNLELNEMTMPQYNSYWGEVIIHSNTKGKFVGIDISEEIRDKIVVQEDLWIEPGDVIDNFTGANQAIGTLIIKCDTYKDVYKNIVNNANWLKVIVE